MYIRNILNYIVELAQQTRTHEAIALGVSTRGALVLTKAAQAYAAIKGRSFVTPDDVKYLAPHVLCHRMILKGGVRGRSIQAQKIVADIIAALPAPTEEWRLK